MWTRYVKKFQVYRPKHKNLDPIKITPGVKKKSKQKRNQSKKEASPDGKRARLAEAKMTTGLQDHLHLRDKTHLEMSRI